MTWAYVGQLSLSISLPASTTLNPASPYLPAGCQIWLYLATIHPKNFLSRICSLIR
jgi:hypothetical protein